MGSSPRSTLDPLQQELLHAFFDEEERFFLTGGGALAGFHLGHRKTREILANKLCTLLSRAELRDLVDVRALERAGYQVEDALEPASHKDAGLTPGQLAWVLSEIEIGADAQPPGVTVAELRAYLDDLVRRLTSHAFPSDDSI